MSTTPPIVKLFEFDTSEIADPVGHRHIPGGSFAFKQQVAFGCETSNPGNPLTSGTLVFEGTTFDIEFSDPPSHLVSKVTSVVVINATPGTVVSNMKVFLSDSSALQASRDVGLDFPLVQFATSGIWQPNAVFPSGITNSLPTVVPNFPNLRRQDGGSTLLFANSDANVSQYVYMNMVIPFGHPLGLFGVCGSGVLRLGVVFDYYDL